MDSSVSTSAIFDLDGTLSSGHIWHGVVKHHRTLRINRSWLVVYLFVHIPMWYLHKLHLLAGERARFFWTRNMSWTLRGLTETQAAAMFSWMADEYIIPLLRQDVVERLREHQRKGHRVILLSGAFEGLLAAVGERLGVNEVLGTRLKCVDGHYSGVALPPIPQGSGKIERLCVHASESGRPIEFSTSYAYADSITDLPVLEAVGHPVAVFPDQVLADVAAKSGWATIDEGS